jgi:hypothetical protein
MQSGAVERKTYYVVQSFTREGGGIHMDAPVEARSEASAVRIAERIAGRKASVLVLARTGDPAASDFDEPVVLRSYGSLDEVEDLPF